jgi:ubiquinone/menaquinone biosynthesis C-methylase UbiE
VSAADAEEIFEAYGVADVVSAVNADARDLPFADQEFDAIVSIDAFEYFGTDVHFLPKLLRVLKPGGRIAVSTPGLKTDPYERGIPAGVFDVVGYEAAAWHSPEWWRRHWDLTELVDNVSSSWQPGGYENWLLWAEAVHEHAHDEEDRVLKMLRQDGGREIGFVLLAARRPH